MKHSKGGFYERKIPFSIIRAMEAERKIVAYYVEEIKKEMSLLKQSGVQGIDLPPAEKEKFIKVAYDEGWKDILATNPQTGPRLKELLTKRR